MRKKIWIDTDISVGMQRHTRPGYCDVDDGFAVLQLMKSKLVEIVGISAVFGNTRIDDAFRLSKEMVAFAKRKIPVYKGAGEAINLADVQTNDAVEALAEALKKEKLCIMAIGPATNVGLLLLKYPELKEQIVEVVLVAGRRKPTDRFEIGNTGTVARDLNFDLDNDAFRVLFESGAKVVLCPFEISHKVWIKKEDLQQLQNGDPACQWLAKPSQNWLQQWLDLGAQGFNPFDVLASHYLIAADDLVTEELNAHFEIHPDDTQPVNDKQHFKHYLICDDNDGYPVTYCHDVVPSYHEKLMQSLTLTN